MPLPLIILLIIPALSGLVLLIWGITEPRKLKITKNSIGKGDGICARVLFFSDLHAEFCFIDVSRICGIIREEKPDIVIFGGDIINDPLKVSAGRDYLLKVKECCDELHIPFAGVTGNHDIMIPSKDIRSCGFTDLSEQILNIKGQDGTIIAFNGVKDSGRQERVWYVPQKTEGADITVTVAHNPDAVLNFPEDTKFDLLLSGHIHGGQIRTPIGIEFSLLRRDRLPKMGYIAGLYEINGRKVFISKGIGCVALPFRIGSLPEVNIIDITS